MNKFRGLHLTRTLARSWKVDTIRRLTSGSYPYYAHRRIAAHTGQKMQALRIQAVAHLSCHPVQVCVQGLIDRLAERTLWRKRFLPCRGIVPLPPMFSRLSILTQYTKNGSASADARFFLPVALRQGFPKTEVR